MIYWHTVWTRRWAPENITACVSAAVDCWEYLSPHKKIKQTTSQRLYSSLINAFLFEVLSGVVIKTFKSLDWPLSQHSVSPFTANQQSHQLQVIILGFFLSECNPFSIRTVIIQCWHFCDCMQRTQSSQKETPNTQRPISLLEWLKLLTTHSDRHSSAN